MSTSENLPAGFFITSIEGQRCTAVPRSLTTLTGSLATAAAAQPPTTTSEVVASTTPAAVPVVATSDVAQPPTTADPILSFTTSTTPVAVASSTPEAVIPATSASAIIVNTSPISSSRGVTSATAASKGTTPTTSSSTPLAVALSEARASPTAATGEDVGVESTTPSRTTSSAVVLATTSTDPQESSASSGISSQPKLTPAPVVGGIVGSIGLIALVSFLFWFFRKRRRARESLLTPLTTGRRSSFYNGDTASLGPTNRGNNWRTDLGDQSNGVRNIGSNIKAGIVAVGASLKSKVVGERSDTPSVNLNRGNSQFIDGPIPQHSRNNSVLSNAAHASFKEKVSEWWDRAREKTSFNWRKKSEPADPFDAARGFNEKQAVADTQPDFSQLLGMDERDLQIQAEKRRVSLAGNTGSLPQLGSLGLNFTTEDPFADPKPTTTTTMNTTPAAWRPPQVGNNKSPFADPPPTRSNPFADPVSRPDPTIPKANTYIADIRRSRGQSIDATTTANNATSLYRPPSTAIQSRYPSSLAPSRDSYRDTVFSSFSANVRKGKGRSDPFDLERPELWQPKDLSTSNLYPNPLEGISRDANNGSAYMQNQARIQSSATFTSKYSSGISSLAGWGDPGPDLGPGSQSSSLRGNASSNGGSGDYSAPVNRAAYGSAAGTGIVQGNLEEITGAALRRESSTGSKASSKNGVGKAM